MISPHQRIIVAIDRSTRDDILRLVDAVAPHAGMVKLGLQAFVANGPAIVREVIGRGARLFLDLKLHDIPNTVASAVGEAAALDVDLLTLHASGGRSMLAAAAAKRQGRTRLLAVTALTSLSEDELHEIGWNGTAVDTVRRLAMLAQRSGVDGVVASPLEIRTIREACGDEFLIVTPGIREATAAADDQMRTMSAAEAVRAGADYLVIGRPITGADDPASAARRIADALESRTQDSGLRT